MPIESHLPHLRLSAALLLFWPILLLGAPPLEQGEVLSKEGSVDWTHTGTEWRPADIGQKLHVQERVRTLALSRAMVQLAELGRLRLSELTTLEILPPREPNSRATLDLKAGALYFFTRDRPREFLIQTPHALAASRGTEFLVTLDPAGQTVFTVFDGEVDLSNAFGSLVLTNGEQGAAAPNQPPVKTAVLQATNLVQWWLYYPAVVDPDELRFSPAETAQLSSSLAAYRQGDLLGALAAFPAAANLSAAGRTYHAAVLLSVGRVDAAQTELDQLDSQPANALRHAIAAVTLRPLSAPLVPQTASEWLAESYIRQARFDLAGALEAARQATLKSPQFGLAWSRVAELQFSHGRRRPAIEALARSLELSPRNAQAWALQGFIAAEDRRLADARGAFEKAIALDPALGNGWLGRGLILLREGHKSAGRADLQTAAATEPNRSLLRSYLGKAFEHDYSPVRAEKELRLAEALDQGDPTPWLYSALVLRQQLEFNRAVDDLQHSIDLNDNRAVYRSRLLLDQDLAVRNASLATIYGDAGMREVSAREAARAVSADYGNPSAHLFLAESFNALRDPTRFNLRIEPAWFNELLLANLLAPVGGGSLSQNISQQEYSRLFASDRLGLSSFSEVRSDGQYRELASQFGTYHDFSYALDLDYQHNDGVRPNNELSRIEWYSTAKFQLTPDDSLLVLLKYQDYHSGDNFQYYDPSAVRRDLETFGVTNAPIVRTNFTFDEYQKPIAVLGYHRQWAPGMHTLFLGGRLENDQRFTTSDASQLILSKDPAGNVVAADSAPFDIRYRSVFEAYTSELNQILQFEHHTLLIGGRFQTGHFNTTDQLNLSPEAARLSTIFDNPAAALDTRDRFERISGYGYYTWQPFDALHLTAGLVYDRLTYPENFRMPPISDGSITRDQLSPKAALVWSPLSELTLRGMYARSLGGVTFDDTFRLEPTQLAGFSQTLRNPIPESIVGSLSGTRYDTAGAALDVKLKSRTFLVIQGEFLNADVRQQVGVFDYNGALLPPPPATPSSTPQHLVYDEYTLRAGLNQLVSDEWSFGTQYAFIHSRLHTVFPEIPTAIQPGADRHESADLQQATLFALFNHSSGFFARVETQWYHQANSGYSPARGDEDIFMHNIFAGYRLRRQRAEAGVGILNLAGTDYRLNPLNPYSELPRERVFIARLTFNF
ncbi:MAG TPA: TonB-dependent receptor [Methylomirabilota bacterium]|nr:TonB-dependent receptor [Methylomirabilota bacterium]